MNDAQTTINEQRRVADECIAMKNKEISFMDSRERSLLENFQKLQKEYEILDRQHIRIKAAEYDKVDVLKQNVELQGKLKSNMQDINYQTQEKERVLSEV